jgi:hypothetical protein
MRRRHQDGGAERDDFRTGSAIQSRTTRRALDFAVRECVRSRTFDPSGAGMLKLRVPVGAASPVAASKRAKGAPAVKDPEVATGTAISRPSAEI